MHFRERGRALDAPPFCLKNAIRKDELLLEYQPIVELSTGRIAAAEALVRWRHPTRGVLAPGHFLPALKRAGEHRELDLWVLATATRELRALEARTNTSLRLSVNLSPQHLCDLDSITEFARVIQEECSDPSRLILEVVESAALCDTVLAVQAINRLKKLGVRFAIDDFGTGFATLDYLACLPADFIKIDRAFIGNCGNAKHAVIIEAVLALARRLDIETIMEGIEQPAHLAFSQSCGARYGQGFLLCRPVSAAQLETHLPQIPALAV